VNKTTAVGSRGGRLPARMFHEKFVKACKTGCLREVEQLFNVGSSLSPIDVDRADSERKTALFYAIVSQKTPVVRFLVTKCQADVSKRSFVFFGCNSSAVNLESCDEPPVVTAARAGTAEILSYLLQVGGFVRGSCGYSAECNIRVVSSKMLFTSLELVYS
jgi:hypothetical protein